MIWVSSYLIRQVATDEKKDVIDGILGALKNAKTSNDPLVYARSRFVKIGEIGTDFAISNNVLTKGKDFPDGTIHDGCIVNGIAKFFNDSSGLTFCMCKDTAYDSPVGEASYWAVPCGGELDIDWISYVVGAGQLWRENKTGYGNTIYKVLFMWNIPLFNTSSEALSYSSLVTTYWGSGQQSDLDAIGSYLDGHMVDE